MLSSLIEQAVSQRRVNPRAMAWFLAAPCAGIR